MSGYTRVPTGTMQLQYTPAELEQVDRAIGTETASDQELMEARRKVPYFRPMLTVNHVFAWVHLALGAACLGLSIGLIDFKTPLYVGKLDITVATDDGVDDELSLKRLGTIDAMFTVAIAFIPTGIIRLVLQYTPNLYWNRCVAEFNWLRWMECLITVPWVILVTGWYNGTRMMGASIALYALSLGFLAAVLALEKNNAVKETESGIVDLVKADWALFPAALVLYLLVWGIALPPYIESISDIPIPGVILFWIALTALILYFILPVVFVLNDKSTQSRGPRVLNYIRLELAMIIFDALFKVATVSLQFVYAATEQ